MASRPAPPPRTRVRYGRLPAVAGSAAVTLVAVLGGLGVIPAQQQAVASAGQPAIGAAGQPATGAAGQPAQDIAPAAVLASVLAADPSSAPSPGTEGRFGRVAQSHARQAAAALEVPLDSGEGRRVVFDAGAQRVWLVTASGEVRRTYPVSGSVLDNLDPGTYEVYSRSEQAWGIDDSGTMRFMVRFTRGQRAAIGFHDIPRKDGRPVQGREDLGTPQSHGCIRQWRPDAKALWRFAPVGTTVVVV